MYNCISVISEKKCLKLYTFGILIQTDFPEDSKHQMPENQTVSHSQSFFERKNDVNFLALVQSRIE